MEIIATDCRQPTVSDLLEAQYLGAVSVFATINR